MKKLLFVIGVVLLVAGCKEGAGGSNDEYNTGTGASTNAPSQPGNPNQGSATSPGGQSSGGGINSSSNGPSGNTNRP